MKKLCQSIDYVIPLLFFTLNIEYAALLVTLYQKPWPVIREFLLSHALPLEFVSIGILLALAARLICYLSGYRSQPAPGLKPDMNWNFWKYYVPAYISTATLLGIYYAFSAVEPGGLIAAIMLGFYLPHLIILGFSFIGYLRPFPF